MSGINAELLLQVAQVHRKTGDALITVQAGEARRTLHLTAGCLIGADSNLKSERLGDVLAAKGQLDSALIEPVAAEARRQGRLLGDQLIADGLLAPGDLAGALERQVLLRFEHAITMAGQLTVGPTTNVKPVCRHPVGALVVEAFRERLPLEDIEAFVANRSRPSAATPLSPDAAAALRLAPAEFRIFRRLAAQEPLRNVLAGAASPEPVMRLVGALVALGLWS